jgi:hypothetical protein
MFGIFQDLVASQVLAILPVSAISMLTPKPG